MKQQVPEMKEKVRKFLMALGEKFSQKLDLVDAIHEITMKMIP
jgi:predicted nucleic acid-binding protein